MRSGDEDRLDDEPPIVEELIESCERQAGPLSGQVWLTGISKRRGERLDWRTPCGQARRMMIELGIRLYVAYLYILNTVQELESSGNKRSRKVVHDWVHKCDLHPTDEENPNHVSLDETVIQLNEHRYWLYTTVDPETNNSSIYGCIQRLRSR